MLVTLNDSKAVETVQPITSDTVIAAGMTYNLPGVPIADIVELRGAIRLPSGRKFKLQVRYDTHATPTNGLGGISTVIDQSATATLSQTYKGEQPSAGGYYIVQIVNADTVDMTITAYYERRFKKYA